MLCLLVTMLLTPHFVLCEIVCEMIGKVGTDEFGNVLLTVANVYQLLVVAMKPVAKFRF